MSAVSSTFTLLNIRLRQFMRALAGIGLLRAIILLILIAAATIALYSNTKVFPNTIYTASIYLICIIVIQIKRKDKIFLRCNFYYHKQLLMVEYHLLASPLYICLLIHYQWLLLLSSLLVTTAVVHIAYEPQLITVNSRLQQWIPPTCFEWKAGIRKTLITFILIWTIGMIASWGIIVVPIAIFMLGTVIISFYNENEPLPMLLILEKNPAEFILHKIKMIIGLTSLTMLPLLVAFLIFHTQYWYIPLIEYIIFLILGIYVIVTKYAFYKPGEKSAAAQTMGTVGVMTTICLPLIPVTIILMIRFYIKSMNNLKIYLNDYH